MSSGWPSTAGCAHGVGWNNTCYLCGRNIPQVTPMPTYWNPDPFALGRIADALERIAAALEGSATSSEATDD